MNLVTVDRFVHRRTLCLRDYALLVLGAYVISFFLPVLRPWGTFYGYDAAWQELHGCFWFSSDDEPAFNLICTATNFITPAVLLCVAWRINPARNTLKLGAWVMVLLALNSSRLFFALLSDSQPLLIGYYVWWLSQMATAALLFWGIRRTHNNAPA